MSEISSAQKIFLDRCRRRTRLIRTARVLLFLVFLGIWEWAADTGVVDAFIFSSPSRTVRTFADMLQDRSILLHIGCTLAETLISFILVALIGTLAAVLLWLLPTPARILEPYLVILNSLPKSALAPLLIVWLGANQKTIITAGMSVAIFGSILMLYTGFTGLDPDLTRLISTLGGTKKHVLTKVILPASVPLLISTMKVNIGLCLVGVVIGEFIGSRQGLGYLIIYGSQVFKLDWVILSISLLCIMALLLYGCIYLLELRFGAPAHSRRQKTKGRV